MAKTFYNTTVVIELMSEEETLDMTHVVMKVNFDNTGFKVVKQETDKVGDNSWDLKVLDPFRKHILLQL